MISSMFKQQEFFMKASQSANSDFRMFRDYLGLANMVIPGGIKFDAARADDVEFVRHRLGDGLEMDLDFELEARVIRPRRRMNSIESDTRSETSTSSRSSDSDMYESLSGSEVFIPTASGGGGYLPASVASAIGENVHSLDPMLHNLSHMQHAGGQVGSRVMPPQVKPGGSKNANKVSVCVFCRNNGESREFYSSHTLKDSEGSTTCPILRAYTCPLCKANGDQSHTIKYCPKYTPKTGTAASKPVGLV